MSFSTPGRAFVLFGGQFGSEGKGLIAAWIAAQSTFDIATTNAGAQAGHTTRWRDGRKIVLRHLPTAAVVNTRTMAYLNAGSIIDPEVLFHEVRDYMHLDLARVRVHPRAAVINDSHRLDEQDGGSSFGMTGSTQKGVGAALASKVRRENATASAHPITFPLVALRHLNSDLRAGRSIMVEVPQGFGLSLNHGYLYPHCTSRDCGVVAGLSDAGIHPHYLGDTCMVVRSFPIRVGGPSGPFYPGSHELVWSVDFPDIKPERTTVTNRERRIATWSPMQYREALIYNRPSFVAMTFCDYFKSEADFLDRFQAMRDMAIDAIGYNPQYIFSYGPNIEDVTSDAEEVRRVLCEVGGAHAKA